MCGHAITRGGVRLRAAAVSRVKRVSIEHRTNTRELERTRKPQARDRENEPSRSRTRRHQNSLSLLYLTSSCFMVRWCARASGRGACHTVVIPFIMRHVRIVLRQGEDKSTRRPPPHTHIMQDTYTYRSGAGLEDLQVSASEAHKGSSFRMHPSGVPDYPSDRKVGNLLPACDCYFCLLIAHIYDIYVR